ncbi:MAG: F0F1 ATP synthase subunit A [Solirubrobacteraceae bacterium]|nr:F0F1 ATP synthase subunit A [Solirubrobacteraceae bacterium]
MPIRALHLRAFAALLGVLLPLAAPQVAGAAEEFDPQDEFALPPWIEIDIFGIDLSINKGVAYLLIALILTCGVMIYTARRMQYRPTGKLQTVVESAYSFMRDNIAGGNMDARMAAKWFPFVATLFLFIWFSNIIGYVPLPFNTTHKVDVFGLELPSLAIYSATANLSVPLALAIVVWLSYHVEGIRAKGPIGYIRSWIPAGVPGAAVPLILGIEVLSHFVRLLSLSLRLFANILAGHLLILFMAGGLVVLMGLNLFGTLVLGVLTGVLGTVFFLFEIGLVVSLQAFIFATLAAIYLGGAVADEH